VIGSTTMIFGIIMLLEHVFGDAVSRLSLVVPQIVLACSWRAVIYWFTGATIQAVVAGPIARWCSSRKHQTGQDTASIEDSKRVWKSARAMRKRA